MTIPDFPLWLWFVAVATLWLSCGYISACIRFGTVVKLPIARLLEVEEVLRREVRMAIFLKPWDGFSVIRSARIGGAPLGFQLPIERNYARAFPYRRGRWINNLEPHERQELEGKGVKIEKLGGHTVLTRKLE